MLPALVRINREWRMQKRIVINTQGMHIVYCTQSDLNAMRTTKQHWRNLFVERAQNKNEERARAPVYAEKSANKMH